LAADFLMAATQFWLPISASVATQFWLPISASVATQFLFFFLNN
jgi:hypothetical protein